MIVEKYSLLPEYNLATIFAMDNILSTQGIMVMLLVAYGLAMWTFLTNAPKVYTVMVSDIKIAQKFYEGLLKLNAADIPLHYYYTPTKNISTPATVDPLHMSVDYTSMGGMDMDTKYGLWYQLKKNTQLHIISGASYGYNNRPRHVCFDNHCLKTILLKIQAKRLRYKVRCKQPLNFLVKDIDERTIEIVEVKN